MLRLLATVLIAVLVTVSAAHVAHADRQGAGSAADYEFLAGAQADTMALAAPQADGDCQLVAPYDEACVDGSACWVNDPAAVQNPRQLADVPRPRRDDRVAFMSCVTPSGDQWSRWYWSSDRDAVTD